MHQRCRRRRCHRTTIGAHWFSSVRLKIVTDRRRMHHAVAGVMQPASVPHQYPLSALYLPWLRRTSMPVMGQQTIGHQEYTVVVTFCLYLYTLSVGGDSCNCMVTVYESSQMVNERSRLCNPPRSYGINRHRPIVGWSKSAHSSWCWRKARRLTCMLYTVPTRRCVRPSGTLVHYAEMAWAGFWNELRLSLIGVI